MTKKEWLEREGIRAPKLATDEEATHEWCLAVCELIWDHIDKDKLKAELDRIILEGTEGDKA